VLTARHLRFAARFAAHRLRTLHPFEVQASVLNACNLHCLYCRCPDEKIELLSTDQWLTIIRALGAAGTLRIKFQGGEPTMRPDFAALCAASQAAGIITAVVTNGLQFAARGELFDHLDEVVFSLDSVSPEHTDHMRGENVHARVVAAIDLARAQPHLRIFINMVVTARNLDQIEPMLAFCEARGIGVNVQPMVFGRKYYNDTARSYALSDEQIRTMHRRLAAWKRQGRPLMFAAATYENVLDWSDYGELSRRGANGSACMAGRFYIHIEPNGDVHPCGQHGAAFRPKNIARDGFEAALTHVQRHDCADCFSAYLNERKALFALRPAALLEMARRG